MATWYGTNATKRANSTIPALEVQGEANSALKVAYDNFTQAAALAQLDTLRMMKLPPGARILNVYYACDGAADASGGTIDIGWEANLVDAADDDGFLANVVSTAAIAQDMQGDQGTRPGVGKKFDVTGGPTQVTITADASGGLDSTASVVHHLWVVFTLD